MIVPVVLSGGSGTRLWPLSTIEQPKQFHELVDHRSLIRATVDRIPARIGTAEVATPIIVTSQMHVDRIVDALDGPSTIITEPSGRNTAPAVAAACLAVQQVDPEAIVCVFPSDHHIADHQAFETALAEAIDMASRDHLVTFGIQPTHSATGYGYIRPDGPNEGSAVPIGAFVEKPDEPTAQTYVDAGYLWNSGMFVFKAERFLSELTTHRPELVAGVTSAFTHATSSRSGVIDLNEDAWGTVEAISVDYAVMEHTAAGVVVPLSCGWTDIGSWDALHDLLATDPTSNTTAGDTVIHDSQGSHIHSTTKPIVVFGANDLVIVETETAILVMPRARASELSQVVADLPADLK